ncbi:MAG: hypothetical protein IIA87_04850 [Nanoarchaeota archaeon]|nr:hypothetical protein [Nanoarchaeota archaeon]
MKVEIDYAHGLFDILSHIVLPEEQLGVIRKGGVSCEEMEEVRGKRVFRSGAIDLPVPLRTFELIARTNNRMFSSVVVFEVEPGMNLKRMGEKLSNRLGKSWYNSSGNSWEPTGFYLDRNRRPIVSISQPYHIPDSYCIGLGCYGTLSLTLTDFNDFAVNMGALERVTDAFLDSCLSSYHSPHEKSKLPSELHLNCAFDTDF